SADLPSGPRPPPPGCRGNPGRAGPVRSWPARMPPPAPATARPAGPAGRRPGPGPASPPALLRIGSTVRIARVAGTGRRLGLMHDHVHIGHEAAQALVAEQGVVADQVGLHLV